MDVADDLIPDDVKTGALQVHFLEHLRTMGRDHFAEDPQWGQYCRTIDMLGADCRFTRAAAKLVLMQPALIACLEYLHEDLTELLPWMQAIQAHSDGLFQPGEPDDSL